MSVSSSPSNSLLQRYSKHELLFDKPIYRLAANKTTYSSANQLNIDEEELAKLLLSDSIKTNMLERIECFDWINLVHYDNEPSTPNTKPIRKVKRDVNIKALLHCIKAINIGFDASIKDNKICPGSFNVNVFDRFIQSNFSLLYSKEEDYFYMYDYQNKLYIKQQPLDLGKFIKTLMNYCLPNSWKLHFENSITESLKRSLPCTPNRAETFKYISFNDKVLDIESFETMEHSEKLFIVNKLNFNYNDLTSAECPKFRIFLDEITCGNKSLQLYLQELLGYCISNSNKAEKAFFLYGGGRNGKSVFAKIITMLVGEDNISSVTLNDFNSNFGLSSILDKKLNVSAENNIDGTFNTNMYKSIISGDPITIHVKYHPDIHYIPNIKLIFLTNTLPFVSDTTFGYKRKTDIIPFNYQVKEEDINIHLIDELAEELPGILAFALEGLHRLVDNEFKFCKCDVIDKKNKDYANVINPLVLYLQDKYVVKKGAKVYKSEVKKNFFIWASENQINVGNLESSQIKFWESFKNACQELEYPFQECKSNSHYLLNGIQFVGNSSTIINHSVYGNPAPRYPIHKADSVDEMFDNEL